MQQDDRKSTLKGSNIFETCIELTLNFQNPVKSTREPGSVTNILRDPTLAPFYVVMRKSLYPKFDNLATCESGGCRGYKFLSKANEARHLRRVECLNVSAGNHHFHFHLA